VRMPGNRRRMPERPDIERGRMACQVQAACHVLSDPRRAPVTAFHYVPKNQTVRRVYTYAPGAHRLSSSVVPRERLLA